MAIDELIDVFRDASVEAVLELSARGVAGEKHPGRSEGAVHGDGFGQDHGSDKV